MKIVHLILCGPFNDGWNYQENILPYYHRKFGNDVTIITTPFINEKKSIDYRFFKTGTYADNHGVKIIRKSLMFSNKSKFAKRFRLYNGLYATLENEHPDIIFIHSLQFLDIISVVKYLKRHSKVRVYVDGHEDFKNSAKSWLSKNILHGIVWRFCARLIEPFTKKFYGVLPARVEFLIEMYKLPKEKVELLVLGAEDERVDEAHKDILFARDFRHKFNVAEDDFLIVTGGKIDSNKPQTLNLMEAVRDIPNEKIKLIIFGSVSSEYEEKFTSLLSNKVQYIGWIDPKETYKYFQSANLVIFPGLHSVFWEQVVGLGRPCVFKYIEGFTHVDIGGNCVFLYKDSVEELKEVITRIASDMNMYEKMMSAAQSKGTEVFSYENISRKSIEM